MRTRPFGKTGIEVSAVGYGPVALSLEGRPPEEQAKQILCRLLQEGLTFLDTADTYGPEPEETHHNERLIGQCHRGTEERGDRPSWSPPRVAYDAPQAAGKSMARPIISTAPSAAAIRRWAARPRFRCGSSIGPIRVSRSPPCWLPRDVPWTRSSCSSSACATSPWLS